MIQKDAFDVARENIRQIVLYMRHDLQVPADMIKVQLDAIIHALMIQERARNELIQK